MEKILEIIGNKKLISAFQRNDAQAFEQISLKLYKKARLNQDKLEYLLAECIKYSRREIVDIESTVKEYMNIECQERAFKARVDIQSTDEFIEEEDTLKRFAMKEEAYERAYASCKK